MLKSFVVRPSKIVWRLSMNLNLKMTVEWSKRRSYFLSLVSITKCFSKNLRAIDSKYGESNDSSENSDFLLLRLKDPFGELRSEIYF